MGVEGGWGRSEGGDSELYEGEAVWPSAETLVSISEKVCGRLQK